MRNIKLNGEYNAENNFNLSYITGDTDSEENDFNLAMQILRVIGLVEEVFSNLFSSEGFALQSSDGYLLNCKD